LRGPDDPRGRELLEDAPRPVLERDRWRTASILVGEIGSVRRA
jgi:hypothetical protein